MVPVDGAALSLTPHSRLVLISDPTEQPLSEELGKRLQRAFERGTGHGLLLLGAEQPATTLPLGLAWWREFGARYVTALCTHQESGSQSWIPVEPPPSLELEYLVATAPPMTGAEYLTSAVLETLWRELDRALETELSESKLRLEEFLKGRNPAWNLVGRVHFNLAENRKDPDSPFAFLATYTTRLSSQAKAQHLPLGQALREYAGAANKNRLLSLLLPVQRAAEMCPWLKTMVEAEEIFHPLRWTPE